MKKQKTDWLLMIEQWQQSGENQAAFCRKRNLPYWSFRDALKRNSDKTKPQKSKKSTPFIKLPETNFPKNQKFPNPDKPWFAISLGSSGFRFEVNFTWGR